MANYNIPSLGAIISLHALPEIRFLAGSSRQYVADPSVTTTPGVAYSAGVVTRAEVLVRRRDVAFALDGFEGLVTLDDDRAERAAELAAYETAPAPATTATRRRGRPRRAAPVEDDADTVEAEVTAPPRPWSDVDEYQVLAIDITGSYTETQQLIPLLQAPPIANLMARDDNAKRVVQSNYEKLIGHATAYLQALDSLHQSDPTSVPANEFMMPSAVGLEELDIETRRINHTGLQTHQQRLREAVNTHNRNYDTVMSWFAKYFSNPTVEYVPFDSNEITMDGITVTQTETVSLFFKNEFIEVR